jgi:protease PrsW
MAQPICCVDEKPIEGPVKELGGRFFCEQHFTKLTQDRKGMWAATLVLIVALVIFVLIVFAVAPLLPAQINTAGLVIEGVILSLIPAALWLVVFYLQDRVEPEPKVNVLGVFLLGALLARAVGQPVIEDLFRVQEWASDSLWLKIGAGILIVGAVQEFLKYAAVRYTIFRSPEFDEHIDGIIYGAAAGLGYATMLNISYVVGSGGVDLGIGAVRIAVTALAHASFAGLTGYFLGRAKFANMGPLWLPAGLLLASILNGVVITALGAISRSGLQTTPIRGLILVSVIAAVTFGVLFWVMRRNTQTVLKGS